MDERDLDELRAIALSVGRLLGRLEQEQQSQPPADPPAFLTTGMRFIAQEGSFSLYARAHNNERSVNAEASQGGDETMSLQFTDGSFRKANIKTGLLQYRWMHEGKQRSCYGYSKEECYLKRLHYKPPKPRYSKPKPKAMTFDDWAYRWMEAYKRPNVGAEYMTQIEGVLRNHLFPKLRNRELPEIGTLELQEILVKIRSDNVRTKCASVLSELFRDALLAGYIERNPYLGVKIKRYRCPTLGALTHVQQRDLLNYVDANYPPETKFPAFVRALLMTGMRQGELNALQAKNVDFEHMEIRVVVSWSRQERKLKEPKTANGRRTVPMAAALADILRPLVEAAKDPDERIFGWDDASFTYRTLSDMMTAVGMEHFTGHILRHTFITNAYELGFPPYVVKYLAGHASIEQGDTYMALRRPADFIETEITAYMRALRELVVIR